MSIITLEFYLGKRMFEQYQIQFWIKNNNIT
jgi:hypothetical protein